MLAEYSGVLVLLAIAVVISCTLLGIHLLVGPRRRFAEKLDPFECGEKQIVSPHQRYSVKFYLVAMLFILFDVEAVFLYPWGALFSELGWFGLVEMFTFVFVLAIGLAYVWMKGALEW
jgi:NADH-quinone oxidoreductase subunit A